MPFVGKFIVPKPTKMKKITILLFFLHFFSSKAQIVEGDIMFVGYNSDGNDGFAIVALVDIPINSTFYFSDNKWNGSPIGSGGKFVNTSEGEITWLTGGAVIKAGTVVVFNDIIDNSLLEYGVTVGTISGEMDLGNSNEVLYMYEGADDVTPTRFISAISNATFNNGNGTLSGTQLVNLETGIAISGNHDVMVYNGLNLCNTTVADCAEQIATPSDWLTDDGSGDQSNDATPPNFPADVPPSFTGSALPIELLSFELKETVEKKVLIQWVTLSEINNDYFSIEKSANLIDWDIIKKVEGGGNSLSKVSYSFIDESPFEGINYYRLKQTDFDGKFSYSTIEAIEIAASHSIKLYPNPSKGIFYFPSTIVDHNEIRVFSIIGEDITGQINIQNLSNETKIDLSFQSNGIYLLRLKDQFHRIVKY